MVNNFYIPCKISHFSRDIHEIINWILVFHNDHFKSEFSIKDVTSRNKKCYMSSSLIYVTYHDPSIIPFQLANMRDYIGIRLISQFLSEEENK